MTKTEYLNQLQKYLRRLPHEDYENTMEYFTEYFEEVGEDDIERAIAELGTPKEAASELIGQLLERQTDGEEDKNMSLRRNLLLSGLAILAAPIGIPLLIAAVAVLGAGVVCIAALLVCGASIGLSGFLVGGVVLVRGCAALTASLPGALVLIGMALFVIGAGIAFFCLMFYLVRWSGRGIALAAGKISRKAGKRK